MAAETSHRDRRNIGYCTNVHAGATLDETRTNLARHAVAVRSAMQLDGPLGIGLWLSGGAAREMVASDGAAAFADQFYRALGDSSPAAALAAAQRAMLSHERYSAPYHWAPYQLAGDDDAPGVPHTSGGSSVQ